MKSNALKVFQMQVVDAPELLSEALTDELFDKIKMQRIPIAISNISGNRMHGFCSNNEFTQENEIVIASELFDVRSVRLRSRQIEEIINVYLHECAHRLMQGHGHNAAFLCLNMVLHLRARDNQIWHVTCYDVHEEKYKNDGWKWASELAYQLADDDMTAEECANVVISKYALWKEEMDRAPELAAQAKEQKQVAIAQRKKEASANQNLITNLKQDRWLFSLGLSILTFMISYYFLH